jgi:hypothetical protein
VSDAGTPPGEHQEINPPEVSPGGPRTNDLQGWIGQHRSAYTASALEASAIAAGYTRDEFQAAFDRARQREALKPIRSRSRRLVVAAYGLTWILFAIPYLTDTSRWGFGGLLQLILTASLGMALFLSWIWTRWLHPDPSRSSRAALVLLSLPFVLLIGIAGLCVPYLPR